MARKKTPEERMAALKQKERKLQEEIAAALIVEQIDCARSYLKVPDISTAIEYLEAAFGDARRFLEDANAAKALSVPDEQLDTSEES